MNASASFYSNVDYWSERPQINFGPVLSDCDPLTENDSVTAAARGREFEVKVLSSQDMLECPSSQLPFNHEWLGHDRVKKFRDHLPFKVTPDVSLFDLSQKVRNLTKHGVPQFSEINTDPLEYLQLANEEFDLNCRYFSVIYETSARMAGYTTRLISLSKTGDHRDHAVSEVFAPQFGKWILIDCDFNISYQREGIWLNAHELHSAWREVASLVRSLIRQKVAVPKIADEVHKLTKISLVELGSASAELRRTNMYGQSPTGMNLEFFEYVLYQIRNDYLSASYPPGHPTRTTEYYLDLKSQLAPPAVAPEAKRIANYDDLYWSVGRTGIGAMSICGEESPTIEIQLSTWTPNFQCFEYRLDQSEWTRNSNSRISFACPDGIHSLEARSVNLAGLRGEPATLKFQVTATDLSLKSFKE